MYIEGIYPYLGGIRATLERRAYLSHILKESQGVFQAEKEGKEEERVCAEAQGCKNLTEGGLQVRRFER